MVLASCVGSCARVMATRSSYAHSRLNGDDGRSGVDCRSARASLLPPSPTSRTGSRRAYYGRVSDYEDLTCLNPFLDRSSRLQVKLVDVRASEADNSRPCRCRRLGGLSVAERGHARSAAPSRTPFNAEDFVACEVCRAYVAAGAPACNRPDCPRPR